MEFFMPSAVEAEVAGIVNMESYILCTNSESGFVTSDSPVVWFDPEAYKLPPLWRSPGLATRTLEISMPISPQRCVIFTHGDNIGEVHYIDVDEIFVSEINRRTRFAADDAFVSRLGYVEPWWFDKGKEPDDSWEKTHQKKNNVVK
jgi:hypothetical protein